MSRIENSPDKQDSGTTKRFIVYMALSFCSMQGYAAFGTEFVGLREEVSYSITLVLVSIQNFFVLLHYVYRTSHSQRRWQFVKYLHSIVGFRLWEYALFLLLHTVFGVFYQVAILIVQGQSIFLKATLYKNHVFRISESETARNDISHDPLS